MSLAGGSMMPSSAMTQSRVPAAAAAVVATAAPAAAVTASGRPARSGVKKEKRPAADTSSQDESKGTIRLTLQPFAIALV